MTTRKNPNRSHHCGELRAEHAGQKARLCGWVKNRRDFGSTVILTLRDRDGVTQLTVDEEYSSPECYERGLGLRIGACVRIDGDVFLRTDRGGESNPKMATGDIEVVVTDIEVFSHSEALPFVPDGKVEASELTRLQHRYIDMRSDKIFANLKMRSDIAHSARAYFHDRGFLEVETPMLMKSTPEGARDYLVPSRIEPGRFYALPQSPQIYKQLLMMGGIDRYYQLSRCFRDEDLRADRQPEFTQIDFEMSFVDREAIYAFVEGLFASIFRDVLGVELELPFARMTYHEAMDRYGEDKPDLRYGLELTDVTELFVESEFKVFRVGEGGLVKGLKFPGKGRSNSYVKKLEAVVRSRGAGGLCRMRWEKGAWNSPIAKNLTEAELSALEERFAPAEDDLVLIVASADGVVVNNALSSLRRHLAGELELLPKEPSWCFSWITDFPYVEYDEQTQRYYAVSHPFTRPHPEDMGLLESDPTQARSLSYDLVLNGFELGSGSLRIYQRELQMRLLQLLGFSEEAAQEQFGFLLDALRYGPPPHGGAAFGLDRLAMLMAQEDSLRDVIAFPKTQRATCPLSEAPGRVDIQQLQELHLEIRAASRDEEGSEA